MNKADSFVLWLIVLIACFVGLMIGGALLVLNCFYELGIWQKVGWLLLLGGLSPYLYWFIEETGRQKYERDEE